MCTLIVMRDRFRFYPLVVAANRDEDLGRPASPPTLRDGGVLAPTDEKAGGTWIAASDSGLFAAVTNRRDVPVRDAPLSRGELPLMSVLETGLEAAVGRVSGLDGRLFNGFHLVIADGTRTFLLQGDGKGITTEALGAGLTVVTEIGWRHFGDTFGFSPGGGARRIDRVVLAFERHAKRGPPRPSGLSPMLDLHDHRAPDEATCRHGDGSGWATRSSTVVRMPNERDAFEMWHRDGRASGGACGERWGGPARIPFK